MSSLVVLALVVTSLAVCCGRPQYRSRIPNAGSSGGAASLVPAPFGTANVFCISVGHNGRCDGAPYDGGNPFGKAFLNAGLTWTTALCMADSDNDGDSNGVELGDPMCTWTAGTTPPVTTGLSHPGYSCSTSSNPFCVPTGTATAPPRSTGDDDDDDDDDDDEEEHAPSWESAVGCACVIFAVKYILILFSGIKAECETTREEDDEDPDLETYKPLKRSASVNPSFHADDRVEPGSAYVEAPAAAPAEVVVVAAASTKQVEMRDMSALEEKPQQEAAPPVMASPEPLAEISEPPPRAEISEPSPGALEVSPPAEEASAPPEDVSAPAAQTPWVSFDPEPEVPAPALVSLEPEPEAPAPALVSLEPEPEAPAPALVSLEPEPEAPAPPLVSFDSEPAASPADDMPDPTAPPTATDDDEDPVALI